MNSRSAHRKLSGNDGTHGQPRQPFENDRDRQRGEYRHGKDQQYVPTPTVQHMPVAHQPEAEQVSASGIPTA